MSNARQPGEGEVQPGAVLPSPNMVLKFEDMPEPGRAQSSHLVLEDVVVPPPGLDLRQPGEASPQLGECSPPGANTKNIEHDDARLRTYLVKRGLTNLQIEKVLQNNRRQRNLSNDKKSGFRRFSQPVLSRSRQEALSLKEVDQDAEGSPKGNKCCSVNVLSIVMPSKNVVGQKLIKKFLESEKEYCTLLECLKDDYYLAIAEKADQGKFQITRSEVDDIFRPVVELFMFHRSFYSDLYTGTSITQTTFFRVYTQYIKSCTNTVHKMRDYCRDNKLQKCLSQIRQKSPRQKDDLVDLLLRPLDRIIDYKHFFLKLCSIANQTQTAEYEFLVRASKSVCRASSFVEKYKCGIVNRNEMNKIQQFLGDQCNVFGANRSIIRQGKMYSQTKGWASRNKRFIFFLFTDILLWTTKKGELQNAVYLQNCKLLQSFSKSNPERKFQIEFSEQIHKPLLLECKSQRQRNEWYLAISVAVENSRSLSSKAWIRPEKGINDEKKGDEDSIAAIHLANNMENREEGEAPVNFVDELNYVDGPDASSSGGDDFSRYEYSHNYPNQAFGSCESVKEYSSGEDLGLAQFQSAPYLAFDDGRNNASAELKAAFRRSVIMSPKLNPPAPDEANGIASFSIRRNSLSKPRSNRSSPKKDGLRLSRVDEENRVSEMEEKEIEYSNSSVKLYHRRKMSIIRRLSQSAEEVRIPPGARRRSLYSRIPQPKKGIRRSSCATRSKIPGSQPLETPLAQPGARQWAQPGAQSLLDSRRGSFFKLSLNDFNER